VLEFRCTIFGRYTKARRRLRILARQNSDGASKKSPAKAGLGFQTPLLY
jgi:hypothetical protein